MVERVILFRSDEGRVADGIRDYSERLVEELARQSIPTELRVQEATSPRCGIASSFRIWRETMGATDSLGVVLQYMPFSFARWGFAPWLPLFFLAMRVRARRPTLAVMVHEPYVPMNSWRWVPMSLWQRFQLELLRLAADVVFTSIEPWAIRFGKQFPNRPVHHLPVGSNFPDARAERSQERKRMEIDDDTFVVVAMGRDHPSWLGEYVVEAVNLIAASKRSVVLLSLGADTPVLSGLKPEVTLCATGYLDALNVSRKLAASDLFLAPLIDGVSTRRTTVMAALQHGLPVVGTVGPLTDSMLRKEPGLRLSVVGDVDQFAGTAAHMADDASALTDAGAAARQLYESQFDWPVIVQKMLSGFPSRRDDSG